MLNELKNLKYFGGKEGLLFFICDVIGGGRISIHDAEIICSHAHVKRYLSATDLIKYCLVLGWIQKVDNILSISPSILPLIVDKNKLNDELIISTVNQLFAEHILDADMFFYDATQSVYAFRKENLPLSMSCVRNVLTSQGFFVTQRADHGTQFYIASTYDALVARHCKMRRKQLSLERLKKEIENNELAGEKAERFVLDYEKRRIGKPLCEKIKRISEIDVSAGYDIVSFEKFNSQESNRYIEVKAVSHTGFFWSNNELEMAKLKGELYYIYLVDLSRVDDSSYSPEIIQNPALNIIYSDDWFVEANSYFIKRIQKS